MSGQRMPRPGDMILISTASGDARNPNMVKCPALVLSWCTVPDTEHYGPHAKAEYVTCDVFWLLPPWKKDTRLLKRERIDRQGVEWWRIVCHQCDLV